MQIGYKKSGAENAISLLQGIDQGAQNYAQGKRYKDRRADEQQQADRSYSLRLAEDARANEANKRANDAAARAEDDQQFEKSTRGDRARSFKADADYNESRAKEAPLREGLMQEDLRAKKSVNDQQQEWAAQQQQQDDEFEAQVESDSHKQEQAQEFKRVTGKDVPPEYWESDNQSRKPGHWTNYDPKSPIPIKVQIDFNKRASELSTLPADATRAEKVAALRRDTQKAIVDDAKSSILDEANQRAIPKQQPGGKPEEQDPNLYVPPDKIKQLEQLAKDPTVNADEMRKAWEAVKNSHAEELAAAEARQLAVEGMDMHAQRMSQQQADYGDMMGETDPEAFEAFRKMRHKIAESKLSGTNLRNAVNDAKELLTPGPKPKKDPQNDKTGMNAGEAIKNATSALSGTPEYLKAKPEERRAMIQEEAAQQLRMAQSLAGGDMPKGSNFSESPNGSHPNTPGDQARASKAVEAQGGSRATREADIRAHPEKYKGKFKTEAELEKFLNGG